MKALYAILAALAVVLVAVPAPASPVCQTGHCPPVVHQQAIAVAPIAVVTPLYGAGYVGGYGAGDDETKELLRQLLKEIQAMRQDLAAGGSAGTLNSTAPKGPDVFAIFRASCVSCHSGDKPKGDFALVDGKGQFRPLSPPERRSVVNRIDGKGGGAMPPAKDGHKPLTAAEKAAVKAALSDSAPIPAGKN